MTRDLTWLLDKLLANCPDAHDALLLSADGLERNHTAGLSKDKADQLAAIASGLQSLGAGASVEVGDGTGTVRHCVITFGGGVLVVVQADHGSHVAVLAAEDADVGRIGHYLDELVRELGEHLQTPAREPDRDGQPV
jgi:predicted regulator of Ras-like GTPase activity (Roadblock/LC7/MglB family)